MKNAIILAGGGSKGAYQAGFAKAIKELNIDYDIVTGTSIGALNGCLLAQKELDRMIELWNIITRDRVISGDLPDDFDIDKLLSNLTLAKSVLTQFKDHKVNNDPLMELIKEYFNPTKLKESNVDFSVVTVNITNLDPVCPNKEEMIKNGVDYLIGSSACFPAFPIYKFKDYSLIDGGYYDNLPIDLAINMGATNFIAVDLNEDLNHPHYIDYPNMTYIYPKESLGSFLNFDHNQMQRNIKLGYNDTMKVYKKYSGFKYTFKPFNNDELIEQFYLEVLNIEIQSKIGQNLNNNYQVMEDLKKKSKLNILTKEQIFYITIDGLLELFEYDSSEVYNLNHLFKVMLDYFHDSLNIEAKGHIWSTSEIILKRVLKKDQLNSIELIINMMLYPESYSKLELKYQYFDPMYSAYAKLIILLSKTYAQKPYDIEDM